MTEIKRVSGVLNTSYPAPLQFEQRVKVGGEVNIILTTIPGEALPYVPGAQWRYKGEPMYAESHTVRDRSRGIQEHSFTLRPFSPLLNRLLAERYGPAGQRAWKAQQAQMRFQAAMRAAMTQLNSGVSAFGQTLSRLMFRISRPPRERLTCSPQTLRLLEELYGGKA